MILQLQTFTTMLQTMSAGLQGRAAQLVDLSIGSVLRALLESCASVALWMQWLILQVLSMTRAATSEGVDLDSWMADFSFSRLPGSASNGMVIFSRFTAGIASLIPIGTSVLTSDASLQFFVIEDQSNPAWSNQSAGYIISAQTASITIPVQASATGVAGNILAGTIGLLGSAIAGVDQVSNPSNFDGGIDVESDASFRQRFLLYINSRSLGTSDAIGAAVSSIQQGIRYCVLENMSFNGGAAPGSFSVIVENGGGIASGTFLQAASAAVDAVRPIGTTFSITAPSLVPVAVQMSITVSSLVAVSTTTLAVQQAVSSWIEELPIGGLLSVSKLEALAHGVGDVVLSVPTTLVNGSQTDLQAALGSVFTVASVNVNVS